MDEDAGRFRKRAREATGAENEGWRETLLELAKDLEQEADKMETGERA